MAKVKCTTNARVNDGDTVRLLTPGTFWQEGDTYEVTLGEAVELFKLFLGKFEPVDNEAETAAAMAASALAIAARK